MANNNPPQSLDDWERELRPRMDRIELIGELDLSEAETAAIGDHIRTRIRVLGARRATRQLRERYPCTFVTYLVFQGIYGYESGDYWSAVCRATGLPDDPNHTREWGWLFETIVKKLGLYHEFPGHRYVGAILGHGGIPKASLPDFFEHMLQPSVTKPELAGLPTPELISEWVTRSPRHFVDKPVLRFLERGERVAEEFVERCRRMAADTLEKGEVPSATEVGLPTFVVEHYRRWVEAPHRPELKSTTGPRWRRPRLFLDPWGDGVQIHLPAQQIPEASKGAEVRWEVQMGETVPPQLVPVRLRPTERGWETEEVFLRLPHPAPTYRCRLLVGDQPQREWSLRGPDDDHPWLAFDAEAGRQLNSRTRLPARPLWLLIAPEVTLEAVPPNPLFIRERLPELPGGWYGWQAYEVDLARVTSLILHSPQGNPRVSVRQEATPLRLKLVGGRRWSPPDATVPLYSGEPPRLRIPWVQDADPRQLSRWRLELRPEGRALPAEPVQTTFEALADRLTSTPSSGKPASQRALELPLTHLLGERPIGRYRLRLRDPRGRSATLRFGIVPYLRITGHEPLYLPDPQQGGPRVSLVVETDAWTKAELRSPNPDLGLTLVDRGKGTHRYQVKLPPDCTEISLRLVRRLPQEDSVSFSLRIPIHRLRWQLVLHPDSAVSSPWRDRTVSVGLDELAQSASPYLLVDLPGPGMGARLRLHLLDADDTLLSLPEVPQSSRRPSRSRRFDLRLVQDTLRQSRSPAIRGELIIEGLPDREGPVTLPVLHFARGIHVDRVRVTRRQEGGKTYVDLAWEPEVPLNKRRVRLWPLTRPWAKPVSVPIPDAARSRHTFSTEDEVLPAGEYLVEFTVDDPWAPRPAPERPPSTDDGGLRVRLGTLEERLAWLDAAIAREGERFDYLGEQALLWQALGDEAQVAQTLRRCLARAKDAPADQVIALAGAFNDHSIADALRSGLYQPHRICAVREARQAGRLSDPDWQAYLNGLRRHAPQLLAVPQAWKVLLEVSDEGVRQAAARQLIVHKDLAGLEALLKWVREGELSETAALETLEKNLDFAARALGARAADPTALRLLNGLAAKYPGQVPILYVQRGYWVRCQVGWGRIERIEDTDGREVPYVHRKELSWGYRLWIALRPDEDAELVVLDLDRGEIHFLLPSRHYLCTKCGQFAARRHGWITGRHERSAHEGWHPRFLILETLFLPQQADLRFAIRRPSDIWQ